MIASPQRLGSGLRALLFAAACAILAAVPAQAERGEFADVQPPAGVIGELVHAKGEVMFSYRYVHLGQDGLLDETDDVSASETFALGYQSAPQSYTSGTHLFEAMWVPLDEVTLAVALPFVTKKMDLVTDAGQAYSTKSSGFGDLQLGVLYHVFEDASSRVHLNLGLSLPTGSTDESDITPYSGGARERLPYAMQLGSGTVDLTAGVTYTGFYQGTTWGTQALGLVHAGTNTRGYSLGNTYSLTGWVGRRWVSWLHTSFRLDWQQWFDPNGSDPRLDPTESPAHTTKLQSGRRLDALFGLDITPSVDGGVLSGTSIAIEAGLPAYQYLDGPQLRTKWMLTFAFQYAF